MGRTSRASCSKDNCDMIKVLIFCILSYIANAKRCSRKHERGWDYTCRNKDAPPRAQTILGQVEIQGASFYEQSYIEFGMGGICKPASALKFDVRTGYNSEIKHAYDMGQGYGEVFIGEEEEHVRPMVVDMGQFNTTEDQLMIYATPYVVKMIVMNLYFIGCNDGDCVAFDLLEFDGLDHVYERQGPDREIKPRRLPLLLVDADGCGDTSGRKIPEAFTICYSRITFDIGAGEIYERAKHLAENYVPAY